MKLRGIILVLIGAGSFGFTPVFVKTGFAYGYTLGQVNLVQMVVAFLLLWALSFSKNLHKTKLSKIDVWKVIGTGTTVGLTSIFYYGAMQYLSASLAIILLFQFVWMGMIYEWIFSKARPTKINMMALVVTLTGVVFASDIIGGGGWDIPVMGLVLGLLSGASYAGFIFFSGQVAVHSHPVLRSSLMVTGSLVLVTIVFVRDLPSLVTPDPRLWLLGLGIALVGAVIPPLFFAAGAPLISGRLANVLSSVELPVAIISAMIILQESVNVVQWFGVLLIIAAIFINEWGGAYQKRRRRG